MKAKTLVACLVSGSWVFGCGSEPPPPDEPPDPSAPEDEVVVFATTEAVSSAATAATSGAGGTASADSSASADTVGSDGARATASASGAQSASSGPGSGGSSAATDGAATDVSATSATGAAGASGGAGAPTGGSGGDSASAGGETETDSSSATSGASGESETGTASTTGDPSTTGEPPPPPPVPMGALLISEYVEGSDGDDKAIELSNVSTETLSLAACRLETYFNGNVESTSVIELAVELGSEQSHVICKSSATPALFSVCDQAASINFNGDDALVLRCDGVVHDSFGQVGADPGTEWRSLEGAGTETTGATEPTLTYGTVDHVLRRRCGALPRTDPTAEFEPALTDDWVSAWDFKDESTGTEFEGLGLAACAE